MARGKSKTPNSSANIGFEAKLWLAADKLRSNMDAAEYKHVVLPGQLFYSTQIPVCLWFLSKNKLGSARASRVVSGASPETLRNRKGETLFIDARKMGTLIDRVHRELTEADHAKIVNTYHAWRDDQRDAGPNSSLNSQPSTLNF